MKPKVFWVLGTLVLCVQVPRPVLAQVPAAVDFSSDASTAATGSAGAARWGTLGAESLNPAIAATIPGLTLQSSLSSSRGSDESSVALRGGLPVGWFSVGIEYQHKTVSDLIEDPAIDESGLGVSDNLFRIVAAKRLGGVVVGAAANLTWSDVFDTQGTGHSYDVGAAIRPTGHLVLGASIRRFGGALTWRTPGGAESGADVPVGYRFGLGYSAVRLGQIDFGIFSDFETGSQLGGNDLSLGVEGDFKTIFVGRMGWRSPPSADAYWTAGIGVRFSGMEAAVSYEQVDVVGPRLQFQLGLTPDEF